MAITVQITVDAHDAFGLATWWAELLGRAALLRAGGAGGKVAKNRIHLDIPIGDEPLDAAVERVVGTGATLVELRQHPGGRWAVMQDPEGNEFCRH